MPVITVQVDELYSRDENLKHEDVQTLQEWLSTQPHLPPLKEYQILAFLHSCYYNTDSAKVTIDKYFTMRTKHPEMFNCLDVDTVRSTLKVVSATILPRKTPEGYAVFFVKLLNFESSVYVFSNMVTLVDMVLTLYFVQHGFEPGGVVVFDSKGFSLTHAFKTSLTTLKHSMYHVQEGAPIRIKGIHFINIVPALEKLKFFTKPFLKAEIYDMIQFHTGIDTLFKDVPQECLPEDYGGKSPPIDVLQEENLKNLLDNYEYFHWQDSQKVDELKRVKTRQSILGW